MQTCFTECANQCNLVASKSSQIEDNGSFFFFSSSFPVLLFSFVSISHSSTYPSILPFLPSFFRFFLSLFHFFLPSSPTSLLLYKSVGRSFVLSSLLSSSLSVLPTYLPSYLLTYLLTYLLSFFLSFYHSFIHSSFLFSFFFLFFFLLFLRSKKSSTLPLRGTANSSPK